MSDNSLITVPRQSVGETRKPKDSIYEPLDTTTRQDVVSTRIVTILPELSEQGRIQCKLEAFFVSIEGDQDPSLQYKALSYVWGPETPKETIEINGKATVIRENLWYALERIRPVATATGRIWIDALCVDQTNNTERNHQVRFMGAIYSQAELVIVWLGVGLRAYDHFWDVAEELRSHTSELNLSFRDSFMSLLKQHDYTVEEWVKCWWEFFKLEYWSRAWVVQEYRLAKGVLLLTGTRAIPDITLGIAGVCVHKLDDPGLEKLDKHLSSEGVYGYYRVAQPRIHQVIPQKSNDPANEIQFEETWQTFLGAATSDCADPRDRVYSQLSLVRFGQSFWIDYTEDVVTLLVRTILFCFDKDKPEGQSCGWWAKVAIGLGLQGVDVWRQLFLRASFSESHHGFWVDLAARAISMELPAFRGADAHETRQECSECSDLVKFSTTETSNWYFCCLTNAMYFGMGISWHVFFSADAETCKDLDTSRMATSVLHLYYPDTGTGEYIQEKMVQRLPVYTNSRLQLSLLTCFRVMAFALGSAPNRAGTSTDGTLPTWSTSRFALAQAGLLGEEPSKSMQPAIQIASHEDSRYRNNRE